MSKNSQNKFYKNKNTENHVTFSCMNESVCLLST